MLQRKNPGIGWVRGDLVPEQEASLEILELKKEIDRLNTQLNDVRTKAPPGTEKLSQGEEEFEINYTCSSTKDYESYSWSSSIELTWDEVFYHVSPIMIHEASDRQLGEALDTFVSKYGGSKLKEGDNKGHSFRNFRIDDEDFQTIKVQLRALGLMGKNEKNRSVKDTGTYWTLTPYGDSVMNRLRAIEKHS